ncbi:MAG: hypothetical protein M3360_09980 [Actinomycetota bacterium]|nr:hypothetical protein [Actinomycetota bacterium]
MLRHIAYALVLAAGLGATSACSGGAGPPPPAAIAAGGPPKVRADVVERHAAQFDRELESRPAGSQQELSAATYILGHLQRAGYGARLEGVPVKNLVSSTDVLAVPPGGGTPATVVTVAYDTAAGTRDFGADIGLFLELARALKVADPRHDVLFAALGAENTALGGGNLGSRRLIGLLGEQRADPLVLTVEGIGPGPVCIDGPEPLAGAAAGCREPAPAGPYAEEGLMQAVASGPPEALGRVLLDLLQGRS